MAEDNKSKILNDVRRRQQEREKTYREKALKLFPWVCARCGRAFSGKKLKELTVHHRDHDHDNNPSDGSNWELLCIYCHENEHQRYEDSAGYSDGASETSDESVSTHRPFEGLADLLKKKG